MKAELVDLILTRDRFLDPKGEYWQVALSGLQDFRPPDPKSFSFEVDMYLTEAGNGVGDDRFSFRLLTPDYLAKTNLGRKTIAVRWHVFMTEWDPDGLLDLINEVIKDAEGETWYDLASKIGEVFFWEFHGLPRPANS